jgi:rhodanese-related sulfurtransferase
MNPQSIKKKLLSDIAIVGRALGHAARLELLDFLLQGEQSVETLAWKSGAKISNISQHLKILRQAGLVESRREGTYIYYKAIAEAAQALRTLSDAAVQVLPAARETVHSYFSAPDDLFRRPLKEILSGVESGQILLFDVRPTDEFLQGHIRGARSVPLNKLKEKLKALPQNKEIVAYCRGPYCVLAVEAVRQLQHKGFRASRLKIGPPEWRSKKLPVATGPEAI